MDIPNVKAHRARLLYAAGLRTAEAVAGSSEATLMSIIAKGELAACPGFIKAFLMSIRIQILFFRIQYNRFFRIRLYHFQDVVTQHYIIAKCQLAACPGQFVHTAVHTVHTCKGVWHAVHTLLGCQTCEDACLQALYLSNCSLDFSWI